MEQAIFHIKTPDEWKVLRQSQPTTEDELTALDDTEFRARFRERCHHTMEIQVYEAIEKKTTLSANQTRTAELYFRVWDKKGLSHDLPDYRTAEVLLRLARALQSGEVPDLSEYARPAYTEEEKTAIDRLLYERRSVRHWNWERPVPTEMIRKVLDAGLWAAHACNLQSIRYLVVHEQAAPGLFRGGDIPPGPVHLVICQDLRVYRANQLMPDYNILMDAGAAGQNILLQAHAQGLGGCWVTFMSDDMRRRLTEKFDLPDYVHPMFYIDVGYPTQTPCPPGRIDVDEALLGEC